METVVQAAVITGTAVIIAAAIQAAGNVVAARKKAADNPATKDIAHEVKIAHRTKRDWLFWFIFFFNVLWWVQAMIFGDVFGSRYMLGLVILMPSIILFMVIVKVLTITMSNNK